MKPIQFFVGTAMAVLLFGVNAAQAQFTLLPSVDDDIDCNQVLNEFEILGDFERTEEDMQSNYSSSVLDDVDSAFKAQQEANEALALAQDAYIQAQTAWQDCRKTGSVEDCKAQYDLYQTALKNQDDATKKSSEADQKLQAANNEAQNMESNPGSVNMQDELNQYKNVVLACAIKTGRISLTMIPYFIKYIADFLLGLSGVIAVLFIVVGGYFYVWGGLTDNKEKGKKTVINALIGLVVAILSWSIISMLLGILTS